MTRTHKAQHFVPKSYLSAWTDPGAPSHHTPFVWVIDKRTGARKPKSPENLFKETDLYTVHTPEGHRDLRLEHGLSQLEKGISTLRKDFIEARKPLPSQRYTKLVIFLSALKNRTPTFARQQRQMWGEILEMGRSLEESLAEKSPEELANIGSRSIGGDAPRMSLEQVRLLADHPFQLLMPTAMEGQLPILLNMSAQIYCSDDPEASFVTSDNPVGIYDPQAHTYPLMFRHHSLLSPTVEITMPLSPTRALLLKNDAQDRGGAGSLVYADVPRSWVDIFNLRTIAFADPYVVAQRDSFDFDWSSLGAAVEDS